MACQRKLAHRRLSLLPRHFHPSPSCQGANFTSNSFGFPRARLESIVLDEAMKVLMQPEVVLAELRRAKRGEKSDGAAAVRARRRPNKRDES